MFLQLSVAALSLSWMPALDAQIVGALGRAARLERTECRLIADPEYS
jgi:hypothetical protein